MIRRCGSIHAYKFMKSIDTIVIPLVGRHAQYNTMFGRLGDYIAAGSFHFKTMAPIEEAVQAQGLCQPALTGCSKR